MKAIRNITLLTLIWLFATASAFAQPMNTGTFVAHLSGGEEVPSAETRARGQAIFKLGKEKETLEYYLIVANIENVTMAHIHLGFTGTNGPVVAWLYPPAPPMVLIEGRFDGILAAGTLSAADLVGPLAGMDFEALIDAIRNGETYVNVHTLQFPGGEVRGQIQ